MLSRLIYSCKQEFHLTFCGLTRFVNRKTFLSIMNKRKVSHVNTKPPARSKVPKIQSDSKLQEDQHDHLVFEDFPNFRPNKTPKEVLQLGSFGGTYFRPIKSSVTGENYKDAWKEFPEDWFHGLNINTTVASPTYDKSINKYKVKCGASLDEWESSGWIKSQDPYGWFQWYCRFYVGRRTPDDERQVGRWLRFLARFKTNLVNKINKAGASYNNYTISPVIRQSLLHWGYEVTAEDVLGTSKKRKISDTEQKKEERNVPIF